VLEAVGQADEDTIRDRGPWEGSIQIGCGVLSLRRSCESSVLAACEKQNTV
jgi:hypothetical protein